LIELLTPKPAKRKRSSSLSSSSSGGAYFSSPELSITNPEYVAKTKLQIELYAGDTIIVEPSPYLFRGDWSDSRKIYEIDATNRTVCLNQCYPLLRSANIQLVSTTRTNVDNNLFNRIFSISECILHSGSIDGLNLTQRSKKRGQMKAAVVKCMKDEAFACAFADKSTSSKEETTTTVGRAHEIVSGRRLFSATSSTTRSQSQALAHTLPSRVTVTSHTHKDRIHYSLKGYGNIFVTRVKYLI
jgi:hypothetical protein